MALTPLERAMLANQLRILEALYPDEAKEMSVRRLALERGYEMDYADLGVWDGLTIEQCREVHRILNMFGWIAAATRTLGDAVSPELQQALTFDGFDGNEEGDLLGYVEFYVETGRYSELRGRYLNSHSHRLPRYRQMLRALGDRTELTIDDLERLRRAQAYDWDGR